MQNIYINNKYAKKDIGAPPEIGIASVLAAMLAVKIYFKGI